MHFREGHAVDYHDSPRHRVFRHLLFQIINDLFLGYVVPVLLPRLDVHGDALASLPLGVGDADGRGHLDLRMAVQDVVHLAGIDLVAGHDDHVLRPVDDVEEPVLVEPYHVAGVDEAVLVDAAAAVGPVAHHAVRPAQEHLAPLALHHVLDGNLVPGLNRKELHFHVWIGDADGAAFFRRSGALLFRRVGLLAGQLRHEGKGLGDHEPDITGADEPQQGIKKEQVARYAQYQGVDLHGSPTPEEADEKRRVEVSRRGHLGQAVPLHDAAAGLAFELVLHVGRQRRRT